MADIVRWDPFTDIRSTMDRLFDEGFSRPWRLLGPNIEEIPLPIDMAETEGEIEVTASLPGVRPDDVEVTVANGVLSIRAHTQQEEETRERSFYRREIRQGTLHRNIALPMDVEAERAEATFENGVLHLRLPKAESQKPKRIHVRGQGGGQQPIDVQEQSQLHHERQPEE
jgi:HSP20 family protein